MTKYKAPFPYFGGKSRISDLVWEQFGLVSGYIEPFAGSAAIALANPNYQSLSMEVLNDFDGMVTNAWRAIKFDPEGVKEWVDWPMSELDLHARSEWVETQREELEARLRGEGLTDLMRKDPHYCDVKIAGWWIWGMCGSIGDAFIKQKKAKPSITGPRGVFGSTFDPDIVFEGLARRLKNTRIACGNWKRVLTEGILFYQTPVAVFLDPPYAATNRHDTYRHESYSIAHEVNDWCHEYGDREDVRIILAGYEGDYDLPNTWKCVPWKTAGGYGNIHRAEGGTTQGRENASRERLWISPSCQPNMNFLDTFV